MRKTTKYLYGKLVLKFQSSFKKSKDMDNLSSFIQSKIIMKITINL